MSDAFVGIKDCGCVVAACVDNPERKREVAKFVGDLIRSGLRVERVTDEWVRENMKSCPHPRRSEGG